MGRAPNEPDPSTGPLALFAAEHRRYRRLAGITQAQLAEQLNYTTQFIGMVEVAARTPSRTYVDQTDKILEAGGGLINCWLLVSRMHVPKWFGPFIDVEAQITAKREWECMLIPGLFQTPEYASALAYADRPHAKAEQIENLVDIRMRRQELLAKLEPPTVWTVIDENALRRPVGGPEIMRGQLRRLLELAALPHVVIQMLPLDAGAHPGQLGAFEILERDDSGPIVWVEQPGDGRFIDRDDQVAEFVRRYDHLRAMALSPAASRKMITAFLE